MGKIEFKNFDITQNFPLPSKYKKVKTGWTSWEALEIKKKKKKHYHLIVNPDLKSIKIDLNLSLPFPSVETGKKR